MGLFKNNGKNDGTYLDEDGLRVDPSHGGDGNAIETSTPLDSGMQEKANTPAIDPSGLDSATEEFLRSTMGRVYNGEIDVYKPGTLLKHDVYDAMTEMAQSDADHKAFIFCNKLREIKGLMDISGGEELYAHPTYQIKHLIAELKFHKEEYETLHGDVFVI